MNAWAVYLDPPIPFNEGVRIQERLHAARADNAIPDTILFLEHTPVITLGTRGRTQHLLASPGRLQELGIDLVKASRGGDVTYHGPGQLIIYPILRLGERAADAHSHLSNLEEVAIRTAADFGVAARRRKGMNGAWTDRGKIAAIGFRLKRWITMHGMSFNVAPDLSGFRLIVPCGLEGEPVSSLLEILGPACPPLTAVRDRATDHFRAVYGRDMDIFRAPAERPGALRELLDHPA